MIYLNLSACEFPSIISLLEITGLDLVRPLGLTVGSVWSRRWPDFRGAFPVHMITWNEASGCFRHKDRKFEDSPTPSRLNFSKPWT